MMDPDKLWRIETGEHLRGAVLQRQRWVRPSADWDHGHCACCCARFARERYTTTSEHEPTAGSYWVYDQCFADLRHQMQWHLSGAGGSTTSKGK